MRGQKVEPGVGRPVPRVPALSVPMGGTAVPLATFPGATGKRIEAVPHPLPLWTRVVKRVLDVVLASVALVLSLPVLIVAMVAVRCESRGPVLFRQVRVGENGRRFRFVKIRTMYVNCQDDSHRSYVAALIRGTAPPQCGMYKLVDDPRITRVGRILRRFSIDELPQLFNVLKGEMSLVGPRPALVHEVELYRDGAWARLRVKPGMTGLWQVSGRSLLNFDEMVALDVRYWQRWSFRQELAILLKTPGAVLTGRGAA